MKKLSFQQIILELQTYWAQQGCAILQPYDMEMGAGTFHPATVLRTLSDKRWKVAYVQPSRRPADSRYGNHPNRMQHYYQFQVILKPSPDNIQDLYLRSLERLGIVLANHDIRFVEDDWKSPTLAASGLGWEIWCDGMEVSQFTYMQQIGGIKCLPVAGEITYGLERLALYIQGIDNVWDIDWNGQDGDSKLTYGDIDRDAERELSTFNLEASNTEMLKSDFDKYKKEAGRLLSEHNLPLAAFEYCIKLSHIFNILDAKGTFSVQDRLRHIKEISEAVNQCCQLWLKNCENRKNKIQE